MDTLSIIKGNSNMVFANWVLVIATMVLALFTFFYMRHTRRLADDTKRMADIMAEEFEFRTTPYIAKVGDQLGWESGEINAKIFKPKIISTGFQSVHIVKIVLKWWYKKSPSEIYRKPINIDCFLMRNVPTEFRIPFNKGDMIKDEESKNLDFPQLRVLSAGRIYAVYIDKNGNEQNTRDLYTLENL